MISDLKDHADRRPFFSVVMPVYNPGRFLSVCLDSVLNQSCQDWELICIDDGSIDGSSELLDRYAMRDERIKIIHVANSGVSAGRNIGIEASIGEWIYFSDSDDVVDSNCLAAIRSRLEQDADLDGLAFQAEYIDENGIPIRDAQPPAFETKTISGDLIGTLAFNREYEHLTWCIWDKVFKRTIIESFGLRFQEGMKIGEDCLFVNMYLSYCNRYLVDDGFVGYHYRMHANQTMKRVTVEMRLNDMRQFEMYYDMFSADNRDGPRRLLRRYAKRVLFSCRKTNQRREYVARLIRHPSYQTILLPYIARDLDLRWAGLAAFLMLIPSSMGGKMLEHI